MGYNTNSVLHHCILSAHYETKCVVCLIYARHCAEHFAYIISLLLQTFKAGTIVMYIFKIRLESESRSVILDSLRPHGLYSPWNSPDQNTRVGSLSLLQGIFPTLGSNPSLPHCRQILYHLSHQGSPDKAWQVKIT